MDRTDQEDVAGRYATDALGYYVNYTWDEYVAEGCPENIPIGLFRMMVQHD